MSPRPAGVGVDLVGPNAVTQLAEALRAHGGEADARAVFADAGALAALADPPTRMIPQEDAATLHRALWRTLPTAQAAEVARDAGRRTGDYLLAHRIPKPAQSLLKFLPAPIAARLLLWAIARHAWTFCGSGLFGARAGRPCVIEIADNPLAARRCDWHAAVFERLFKALVSKNARVRETACSAHGACACRFEAIW